MPHTVSHWWCPGYLCLWVSSSTRVIRCPAQGKENDFVQDKELQHANLQVSKVRGTKSQMTQQVYAIGPLGTKLNLPDLIISKLFKLIQANGDNSAFEWVFVPEKVTVTVCQTLSRFMLPKTKGWNLEANKWRFGSGCSFSCWGNSQV